MRWTRIVPLLIAALAPTMVRGQATSWTGANSSAWLDSANWSNGLPGSATIVLVSAGPPAAREIQIAQPVAGDTAHAGPLRVQQEGRIRIDPEPAPGALIVDGKTQILNGGGIFVRSGRIEFRDDVRINNGGVLNCGSGRVLFSGRKFEVGPGGIFIVDGSTFTTEGSSSTTVDGDVQVWTLRVRNRDTLFVTNNMHVVNELEIDSGRTVFVKYGGLLTVDGAVTGGGTIVREDELPVQLNAFTAEASGPQVTLRWQTATEVDNAGWEVERRSVRSQSSVVGRQTETSSWVKIGFVEGAGTSTSPRTYEFSDAIRSSSVDSRFTIHPTRLVYRLRQVDRSGSFSYSHEAEVEVGPAPQGLTLAPNYPNPFNPSTTFSFTASVEGEATLALYDLTGRLVVTLYRGPVISGQSVQLPWDASGMASGVYVASLRVGSSTATRRIILAR